MSFMFNWLGLTVLDLHQHINELLVGFSLQSNSPSTSTSNNAPDKLELRSLTWGQNPPIFELLDIIELSEARFKGTFKLKYNGQLTLVFNSKVEFNALRLIEFDDFTKPHFILSDKSTRVPVDFKIEDFKLDCLITVVYNTGNVTVVFDDNINDDGMFLDLKIQTSIDDLLNDDLFQIVKYDTLQMATAFIKEDLPSMIHKLKLLPNDKDDEEMAEEDTKQHINPTYYDTIEPFCEKSPQLNMDIFNTMSLRPETFKDVVDRVSLSDCAMNTSHRIQREPKRRKRTIKMNKLSTHNKDSNKSRSTTQSVCTPLNKSQQVLDQTIPSLSLHQSISTSPTLIEQGHYHTPMSIHDSTLNSIEDYLHNVKEQSSPLSKHFDESMAEVDNDYDSDPYESLIHPLDLLPSFESTETNLTDNLLKPINEKLMRPRGPSSNYINLNEFKKSLQRNDEYLHNENSITVFDE